MKKLYLILLTVASFTACKKTDNAANTLLPDMVRQILQDSLTTVDFSAIDFTTSKSSLLPNAHFLYRFSLKDENVLVEIDKGGKYISAVIFQVTGKVVLTNGKPTYNGIFTKSSLNRRNKSASEIQNGFVMLLHTTSNIQTNSTNIRLASVCADCTLPEVIVSSSYGSGGGISWGAWMNLMDMLGMGGNNDYISINYNGIGGGGGGGGGGGSAPVITIDTEDPQNKDRIDPKKFTDCFGTVSDNLATCSITISADLPVDGHPETFFNWTDRSPGHAFIELNKSNPYGSVSQDIGFYPNTSFKVLTGDNIGSKIVNDGGHEYQARYTITVTPAQFQAAIDKLNAASTNDYNVSHYNCTDFALEVFNAAGGGFSIPRHAIPGFEIDGGSNTPQGLYEKIAQLNAGGVTGTTRTNNKEFSGSSKGPCN